MIMVMSLLTSAESLPYPSIYNRTQWSKLVGKWTPLLEIQESVVNRSQLFFCYKVLNLYALSASSPSAEFQASSQLYVTFHSPCSDPGGLCRSYKRLGFPWPLYFSANCMLLFMRNSSNQHKLLPFEYVKKEEISFASQHQFMNYVLD